MHQETFTYDYNLPSSLAVQYRQKVSTLQSKSHNNAIFRLFFTLTIICFINIHVYVSLFFPWKIQLMVVLYNIIITS